MSFLQTFRFPWTELDEERLADVVKKVATDFGGGVVATRTPDEADEVDPEPRDPDEYVRPGVDGIDDGEDDDGAVTWCFGFPTARKAPGKRFAWAQVHFDRESEDEEGVARCGGHFDRADSDPRCEDAFFELVTVLVEEGLKGTLDEL